MHVVSLVIRQHDVCESENKGGPAGTLCMTVLFFMQIVGVNEINEEVVPFSEAGHILREQDMKGNPLTHLITDRSESLHAAICLPHLN